MRGSCRGCSGKNLVELVDLGSQPIAHRLLSSPEEKEFLHPLAVHYCGTCGLGQICDPVDPEELYRDYNYCFSSWKPQPHIVDEADMICSQTQRHSAFEVGCNDGLFLDLLSKRGVKTLAGVEPNPFASQLAREKGFRVYTDWLSAPICQQALAEFSGFETVVARQVLEHIADIDGFFACVDRLLIPDGFVLIELPEIETALSMGDGSFVWEEHVNYFTEPVIRGMLRHYGYEPIVSRRYDFSGVSIAVLARRTQVRAATWGLQPLSGHAVTFSQKLSGYGTLLRETLGAARDRGFLVVLYGVGCRACTVVNGLGLRPAIDFAVGDRSERQHKYMPGSRLPIRSPQALRDRVGPILCLLAVNQESESAVKANLSSHTDQPVECISLFSPNDIWLELERARRRLGLQTVIETGKR